jgi:hypothetical protein
MISYNREKEGISSLVRMTGDWSPGKEGVTMRDIEGIATLVIGVAGVLCVPVLVWATVIAGLYQIVRDKAQETRPAQTDLAQKVQQPMNSNSAKNI